MIKLLTRGAQIRIPSLGSQISIPPLTNAVWEDVNYRLEKMEASDFCIFRAGCRTANELQRTQHMPGDQKLKKHALKTDNSSFDKEIL